MSKVGLIAGIGLLPVEFMRAAQQQGYEVVVITVVPDTAPELAEEANEYHHISVAKLDKIIKTMCKSGVKDVTMLGKVTKEVLYKGLSFPDMRTLKVLNNLRNRKDDTIMLMLVEELEKDGLNVVDQTVYLKPLMPKVGVLSAKTPSAEQMEDISFGFKLAKQIGGLDIGQTVVVKNKAAMAIEAIEGTDECIKRGGKLARQDGIVVKTAKPDQDTRFDVPAVGMKTLESMLESKCNVLAIEAERTLFVEQEKVLEFAKKHGIVICAVDEDGL